jgi:hypothetical protein
VLRILALRKFASVVFHKIIIVRRFRLTVDAMETQQYTLVYCCWPRCSCQQYTDVSVATLHVPLQCCKSTTYSNLLLTIISVRYKGVSILALVIRQTNRILYAPHYVDICAPCDCSIFCRITSLPAVRFTKTKY